MFPKRRSFRGERAKHEAAIGLHAGDMAKSQPGLVGSFIAVRKCVTDKTAVISEGPGVERTGEGPRVALVVGADLVAAMRTAIEQEVDPALLVPRHDDGLRTDRFGDVIVGIRHLALMADIDPGAIPDILQFGLEDRGVVVERT